MITNGQHIQVLIVGAGPSGLMMAAQLLRHGVQPVIIDSKQGPTDESKALGVQARSLEIYRQMGIVDRVIKDGKKAAGLTFNNNGELIASLRLEDTGEGQTAFPFVELYQQSKNERLLLDYLTQNCCPVYWETTLTSLTQTEKQVQLALNVNGTEVSVTSDWVVGADGARSVVRKQQGISFTGETYGHTFYLADIEIDNPELDDEMIGLFLGKGGVAAFFPMPEPKRFRAIGNLPDSLDDKPDLRLEDVLPYTDAISHLHINVTHNYWFTIYKLHHRMAGNFRNQRCFLVGDAAHIHSPVGAQGMNTGLQDAYNLAWKLAGVINNQYKPAILDSFAAERMPVAKRLLSTTDKLFTIIMSDKWLVRMFKKTLLPLLLKFAWSKKPIRNYLFKLISQTGISYRESKLNLHISPLTSIKVGDRLPYLKVYDEKREEETDLHAWCAKPGFTLIILGKLAEKDLFALAKWITQHYAAILNFFYLPPSEKNLAVFEAFDVKEKQACSLIVRPDMHIGFINDKVDIILMDNYLKNVVGVVNY